MLMRLAPSPVVALNAAVARAFVEGADVALADLDALGSAAEMERYHLFHAARADLLRRLGRRAEAALAYRAARAHVGTDLERPFLTRRLREVHRDPADA